MSGLQQIRAFFEYNEWADSHLLDAVAALSKDELSREMGASYGSAQGNLWHIAWAQMLWHSRFTGTKAEQPKAPDGPVLDTISRAFDATHGNLRDFVTSLSEDALTRVFSYTDTKGNARQIALWQPLLHLVNHGTHHRAETALIVTSLGKPMRELDYVFFELERS